MGQEGSDRAAASLRREERDVAKEDEGGFPLTPPAATLPRAPRLNVALVGGHAAGGTHSVAVAASASVAATPRSPSVGLLESPATSLRRGGRGASDAEGLDPAKSASPSDNSGMRDPAQQPASPPAVAQGEGEEGDEPQLQLEELLLVLPEADTHTGAPEAGRGIGRPREATSPEL